MNEKLYSIQELISSDFWPYAGTVTRKLIYNKELKAVNLSKKGSKPFWRITQSAIDDFLKEKGLL